MDHETIDSVLVHVDNSPPIIQDICLYKDGLCQAAVHGSTELSNIR